MSNFQSLVKKGPDKQQPSNTSASKIPFKTDMEAMVFDRKRQKCKETIDEISIEKRSLENPMNSLILGLGSTPPWCWNLIICPYCRISLFGRQQYQEHCTQFHPQLSHLYSSSGEQIADHNIDFVHSKHLISSPPSLNISYKLTKYEVPENLRRVYRHMPIKKVFSYKKYANPKNDKDRKTSTNNLLEVNKQPKTSEKTNCPMTIKPKPW